MSKLSSNDWIGIAIVAVVLFYKCAVRLLIMAILVVALIWMLPKANAESFQVGDKTYTFQDVEHHIEALADANRSQVQHKVRMKDRLFFPADEAPHKVKGFPPGEIVIGYDYFFVSRGDRLFFGSTDVDVKTDSFEVISIGEIENETLKRKIAKSFDFPYSPSPKDTVYIGFPPELMKSAIAGKDLICETPRYFKYLPEWYCHW